jgi:hypothetical protein
MFNPITMVPFLSSWVKNPFSKDNLTGTLLLVAVISILLNVKSCKNNAELKADLAFQKTIADNNYDALNSEVKTLKTKNGELEYAKTILYTDIEGLEKLNKDLAEELKKEKGKVRIITDIETVIEYVPVTVPNTITNYGSGKYGLAFNSTYRDSGLYSRIEGVSKFKLIDNALMPDSTSITKNTLEIDVIYGMRERDDKIEVFARSASPLVSFKEIQGAYIMGKDNTILPDDKPKAKPVKWILGPQIGYNYNWPAERSNVQLLANLQRRMGKFTLGFQTGAVYGIESQQTDLRLGLRFQYNLFQW